MLQGSRSEVQLQAGGGQPAAGSARHPLQASAQVPVHTQAEDFKGCIGFESPRVQNSNKLSCTLMQRVAEPVEAKLFWMSKVGSGIKVLELI